MPVKLLRPVEQIPVSRQFTADIRFAQRPGNIDHFRVEIPDPLHLILGIKAIGLDNLGRLAHHKGIYPFGLIIRHYGEYNAGKMAADATLAQPEEIQFLQQTELPVQSDEWRQDCRAVPCESA